MIINFNESVLDKILEQTLYLLSDKNIISDFMYTYNIKFQTQYTSLNNVFNIFVNIIEYDKFLTLFSKSVKEAVYYTNSNSIGYNLNLIWEKYFKNVVFDYYDYTYNNYEIKKFTLSYNDFFSTFYYYLTFFYSDNNNKYSEDFIKILSNYFLYVFRVLLPNQTYIDIDIRIIYQFIFELPLTTIGTREELANSFTTTFVDVLIQDTWGIIYYNNIIL